MSSKEGTHQNAVPFLFRDKPSKFGVKDPDIFCVIHSIRVGINEKHNMPAVYKGSRIDFMDRIRNLKSEQIFTVFKSLRPDFFKTFG